MTASPSSHPQLVGGEAGGGHGGGWKAGLGHRAAESGEVNGGDRCHGDCGLWGGQMMNEREEGGGGHEAQGWSEADPLQDKAQRGSARGHDPGTRSTGLRH